MSRHPKLECCHTDLCTSDYFRGDSRPYLQIVATRGASLASVKADLHSELNQGAVGGNSPLTRDDSGDAGDAWYKAAHAAINRLRLSDPRKRKLFMSLEPQDENDDSGDCCYAYFVFAECNS